MWGKKNLFLISKTVFVVLNSAQTKQKLWTTTSRSSSPSPSTCPWAQSSRRPNGSCCAAPRRGRARWTEALRPRPWWRSKRTPRSTWWEPHSPTGWRERSGWFTSRVRTRWPPSVTAPTWRRTNWVHLTARTRRRMGWERAGSECGAKDAAFIYSDSEKFFLGDDFIILLKFEFMYIEVFCTRQGFLKDP